MKQSYFTVIKLRFRERYAYSRATYIANPNLIYRWKAELIDESGPVAEALDDEVRQLREELQRTRRERDILKKALAIFSQQE